MTINANAVCSLKKHCPPTKSDPNSFAIRNGGFVLNVIMIKVRIYFYYIYSFFIFIIKAYQLACFVA